MFNKTNISQDEYFHFYHICSGIYDGYLELLEKHKNNLVESENNYKKCKCDAYKADINYYKKIIKNLESEIKVLEFLYITTFKQDI